MLVSLCQTFLHRRHRGIYLWELNTKNQCKFNCGHNNIVFVNKLQLISTTTSVCPLEDDRAKPEAYRFWLGLFFACCFLSHFVSFLSFLNEIKVHIFSRMGSAANIIQPTRDVGQANKGLNALMYPVDHHPPHAKTPILKQPIKQETLSFVHWPQTPSIQWLRWNRGTNETLNIGSEWH